jgi:murein DD-endopeptidase MepM/ murein hydrolase activator NlpD
VGDTVKVGDELGTTQGLCDIYPGMADHFHFEVLKPDGTPVNPIEYMRDQNEHTRNCARDSE